jgi:uncharacterized protein (TIGR02001 family)
MAKLNSFVSKTTLAVIFMFGLIFTADHNRIANAEGSDPFKLPGQFTGSFGFISDYTFRGVSQTEEHPALQGNFDWGHEKGYYLGVWGSNVNFADGDQANIEVDYYAGIAREYYGVTFDVGGVYYAYPGANEDLELDYFEYKFGLSYELPMVGVSTTVFYTPENTGSSGNATYITFDAEAPLAQGIGLTAHIGHQWLTDEGTATRPDYVDWSIGLGYSTNGFDLSVAYVDTGLSNTECAKNCDARAVFGVSRSF